MAKCSNFSEIEGKVPLKRSFQLTGNENMVPVSESPTYPGSHLSRLYCRNNKQPTDSPLEATFAFRKKINHYKKIKLLLIRGSS